MDIRNPLTFAAPLFAGHADGQWTLPKNLIAARDRLARVDELNTAAYAESPESPDNVRESLAAQIAAGGDVDLSPIEDAQRAVSAHMERGKMLARARDIANDALMRTLHDSARVLITEHLRPVHNKLIGQMRRDFAALAHIPDDAPMSVILTAPESVRAAAIRIDAAVPRYDLIRQAYEKARRLGHPAESPDGCGWFNEIRNMEEVWPEIAGMRIPTQSEIPWPMNGSRSRLAWMFRNGAELWIPTADEQAQRWMEVFGERFNLARANRSHLAGYRALGEGAKGLAPAAEGPVAARLFPQHVEATGGAVTE